MQAVIEGLESRALLSADFVIDWNNVAIDVLRADRTLPGPLWPSRAFAMTHAAVFDAVNGFGGPYRQLYTNGSPPNGASRNAAIAQAAHDVLVALYPLQKAFIDDALADSLAQVPNGQSEKKGTQYGKRVADAVLRARRRDHSGDVVQYTVNPAAGHWSSDPMNPGQSALGPGWGAVTPFALNSGDQFLPPHPPAMTSAEYTASYNEVKSLGEKNSVTRTADQKEIGIFWAYDRPGTGTPPALYNQVVQVIANQEGNTVEENARLFALVNIAQADAGITSWDCKYKEDLWRPVTAIRRGAEDGNPDTLAATNWIPLGAPGNGTTIPDFTPPFPAYVSGHATFGAATFEVLRQFYGTDNVNFTLRSDELPGVTRSYTSFSQASAENGRSRIYLGIHWNFDDTAGRALGAQVADWAFDNAIVPRGHGGGHGHGNNNTDVVFSREHIGTTRQLIDDTPSSELELV